MQWRFPKLLSRSAPAVLLVLTLAAVAAFAAVSHLVTRYNANQQARGRKLYNQGLGAQEAGDLTSAIDDFRAALTCDPTNSQYQLSLGRALRDTGDPHRLSEAETYLQDLWQRTPEDGTINLALARLAARRGSIDDALRYYHNAMYGEWNSDPDGYRRKARLELIEFLLKKNARVEAQSELMAFAATLPAEPQLHLQAAALFAEDQDYRDAFAEYEQTLRTDRGNAEALAGAGETAFRLGNYRTADRYLRAAISAVTRDADAKGMLETASLILETDPFVRGISDAERNRRIQEAWTTAGERLQDCAPANGEPEQGSAPKPLASSNPTPATTDAPSDSLDDLGKKWEEMKPKIPHLRSAAETDLPDTIMNLVFEIEQQTAEKCGDPQGKDLALLLISRNLEAADQ